MTDTCRHEDTTVDEWRVDDDWTDTNGKEHTKIRLRCANRVCPLYGKVVRVRQTGTDLPHAIMPPYMGNFPIRQP